MLSDMDSLSFDGYTSYSDSSAPRTPSPRADIPYSAPTVAPQIYEDESSGYRGSLLQDLYNSQEEEFNKHHHHHHHHHNPPSSGAPQPSMPRRATYPYVRHDVPSPAPYYAYDDPSYVVPSNGPNSYYPPQNAYIQQQQSHPYGPPSSGGPVPSSMLPPPNGMGIGGGMPLGGMIGPYGHLSGPTIPIQHTDDAASKETQYLRRRCFNCHTTEPPSWRRSTLNPGKIVCNKCGLYERTHLRPRPLRFDELRAGGKSRKNSLSNGSSTVAAAATGGATGVKTSPKSPGKSLVKKESVDVALGRGRGSRRSSVSSNGGNGSDWDDNGSYSNSTSATNSSYNSPAGTFAHAHLPPPHMGLSSGYGDNNNNSPSPPGQGSPGVGIRLPNAPLSDIGYNNDPAYEYHHNSNEYNHSSTSNHYPSSHFNAGGAASSTKNSPFLSSTNAHSPHLPSLPSPLGLNLEPSQHGVAHADSPPEVLSSVESFTSKKDRSLAALLSSSPAPSGNGLLSPSLPPPSSTGVRNKSHTISTSSPFEAYRERRERSGSVSSTFSSQSGHSSHSPRLHHSHSNSRLGPNRSRSSSILHTPQSARSVHLPLPEEPEMISSLGEMSMGDRMRMDSMSPMDGEMGLGIQQHESSSSSYGLVGPGMDGSGTMDPSSLMN